MPEAFLAAVCISLPKKSSKVLKRTLRRSSSQDDMCGRYWQIGNIAPGVRARGSNRTCFIRLRTRQRTLAFQQIGFGEKTDNENSDHTSFIRGAAIASTRHAVLPHAQGTHERVFASGGRRETW